MYGGAKLKVWQVIVLGALWIALGIILDQAIDWDSPRVHDYGYYTVTYRRRGAHELFVALKLWLTGPVLIGVWHWYRAWEASRAGHTAGESAMNLPVQKASRPSPSAPLPPPPRLGDDPFRDPPAPAPIIVQRPPTAPSAAPIAASGDPDDKPKLLV